MAIQLNDKVCLITEADEGVGFGLVRGFRQRGATVVAGVLNLAQSAGKVAPAWAVQLDVTKTDEVRHAVDEVFGRFGRVDVLINNAGIYPRLPADKMTFAEW